MSNELAKSEITTELMGVRAGLSLISKYTDEIRGQETIKADEAKKTSDAEANCGVITKDINAWQKQIESNECNIKSLEIELEEKRKGQFTDLEIMVCTENARRACGTPPRTFFEEGGCGATIGLALVIWIGGYLILSILLMWIFNIKDYLAYPISASISAIAAVCITPLPLFVGFNQRKAYKTGLEQKIAEEKQIIIRTLEFKLDEKIKKNVNARDCLKLAKEDLEKAALYLENQRMAESVAIIEADKEIEILAEKSEEINNALKDAYGVFIAESDWANIDLIIHYIETGRADTLKEALYQVDRERQNDRIVRAIHAASESICSHIDSAMRKMGDALARSFQRLNRSLQSISSQIALSADRSADANRELLGKLDTQISTAKMNTVLLEKANQSSDKLLEDLRYNQRFWVK